MELSSKVRLAAGMPWKMCLSAFAGLGKQVATPSKAKEILSAKAGDKVAFQRASGAAPSIIARCTHHVVHLGLRVPQRLLIADLAA